jgi:hypothetical protein
MLTKFAVVYSVPQKKRRRVIIPSVDDSEFDNCLCLRPGEEVIYFPIESYTSSNVGGMEVPAGNIDDLLSQAVGSPSSDRCCVITDGIVTAVISADPSIDTIEGSTLVIDETAVVGWTYQDGIFQPPVG